VAGVIILIADGMVDLEWGGSNIPPASRWGGGRVRAPPVCCSVVLDWLEWISEKLKIYNHSGKEGDTYHQRHFFPLLFHEPRLAWGVIYIYPLKSVKKIVRHPSTPDHPIDGL